MRTLIYARFSSHLQNPRSIEQQIAACRARAEQEGWQVVDCFADSAISGAAGIDESQRPGLALMLDAIERARHSAAPIEQVLTESTDRIARHQGDALAVRERIEFAGARLFTLFDGHIDDITGTIKGLFDARFRKDLAARVRRGQAANVRAGRAASGVTYGYRRVSQFDDKGDPVRGLRAIDEGEAEVVRRIFRDYDAGLSPRAIAGALNAEGVPAPRGRIWRASTLIGHRKTGFGVLSNPVYIGTLVYGRSKVVTDPRTRRRQMAPGDGAPITGEAPHLRIIEQDLWDRVQHQIAARAMPLQAQRQRRPKHILSGLGECGVCGGKWIVTRGEYFGCSSVIDANACTNRRLIKRDRYEARVLAALQDQMLAPDVVEAYLDEYRREHARQSREAGQERARLERQHAEAARKVARLVEAVAAGGSEFAEIRTALADARDQQGRVAKALAALDALPRIALHPGLARQYRAAIERLAEELADEHTRREAAPRLRALIARIVITPAPPPAKRGVEIEVIRHIDEALTLATRQSA